MNNNFLNSIPRVTRHLILVNVVVWIISCLLSYTGNFDLSEYLGLHYFKASNFNPAQLITYMFLHDTRGIAHIFFNMFSLFMFGRLLEQVLGEKRFLFYYLSTGIGAALVQEATLYFELEPIIANYKMVSTGMGIVPTGEFLNMVVTVGASGAVFGILLAFGMIFPNLPLYLFFIPIPIKAKYMVIGYGLIELLFGISGAMSGVAHFAHLGGMVFGLVILLYWRKKGITGGRYY